MPSRLLPATCPTMSFLQPFVARLLSRLNPLWLLAASLLALGAQAQPANRHVVTTEQVRAELMAHAPDGVDPGKTVWLGLQLTHQPQWHTYWKNSGDSGLPTTLSWTLPAGVLAGDIAWPVPQKLPIGDLANYGYEGTVLLPVPLTITPDFKPSALTPSLEIRLQASWLVCKLECVPQEGEFTLQLPTRGTTALHGPAFEAAFRAQPQALTTPASLSVERQRLQLSVPGLPAQLRGQTLDFFPEIPEIIQTAAQWTQRWQGEVWTAEVPLSPHRSASPDLLPLVLAAQTGSERLGVAVQAKLNGSWPAASDAPMAVVPSAAPTTLASPAPLGGSLGLALLGALLGGLILNLMPCVFPILAVKVVGFARHSQQLRQHRIGGLAYSAGVVLSFAALGALMLALRAAGEQLGWGFQLQSPLVVAALAALFTVLGLNLAGLFEFGQFVPAKLAALEAKNPAIDAFLSGVLAVLIASPCTAPFMGASLGLALALPAGQALLVFATIGIGMALPYLAASWSPALAARLPRPGAWMKTFRHAMAFPMFATVVWLVWVLGQQSGVDGAAALLALLLALALLVWALSLRSGGRRPLALMALVVLALLTASLGKHITQPPASADTASARGPWQSWTPDTVTQSLASGQAVFVDFTAAWCVTCQYNKKTTLADAGLLADFDARQVKLLRADWTRRDPGITAALAELGRNGVPVYVLYQTGQAPVVLSEILSVAEVRQALARLR